MVTLAHRRELGSCPVLIEHDAVHLLLHVLLDPRVLAAQSVRARDVGHDDLTVEFEATVLEARDLAVVAIALGHIPQGVCAHGAGQKAQHNDVSGAHHAVG